MEELLHELLNRVEGFIREHDLIAPGGEVTCLVSGGADSSCLWHALRKLDYAVSAVHVNHKLRGAESEEDARFCAETLGAEIVEADGEGLSEAELREQRYQVTSCHKLRSTGHTASDQVETILYRLAASPGRRALLGMAPVDGILIRPLLGVGRELTGDYCRERGLGWREDSTNAAATYARNRVRHGLAAALGQLHPAASANVVRTARLLRDEAAVLDEVVRATLAGRDRLPVADLAELSPALARLVVVRLAEDAAGRLVPGAGRRLPELVGLGSRGGSAQLDIGGGVRAVVEYGILRFEPNRSQATTEPVGLPIPGTVRFGAWQLDCELERSTGRPAAPEDTSPAPVEPTSVLGRPPGRPVNPPGPGVGLLDADILELRGLTVRPWRAGDRIAPLGLGGTKTLADLFIDHRIPRAARRMLPVVACGPDIAWVPGLATGERFRITAATTRVAVLRARAVPDPPEPGQ